MNEQTIGGLMGNVHNDDTSGYLREMAVLFCLSRVTGEMEAAIQTLSGNEPNDVSLLIGRSNLVEWWDRAEIDGADPVSAYISGIRDFLDWRFGVVNGELQERGGE